MYNFTVPMALMDYLPVFFFGVTAVLLLRDFSQRGGILQCRIQSV